MGQIIYKVEDDKYVIFSTFVDDVTWFDMDRDDIVKVMVDQAAETARINTLRALETVEEYGTSSRLPRRPITPDEAWEQMTRTYNMNRVGSELTVEEFKAHIRRNGEE